MCNIPELKNTTPSKWWFHNCNRWEIMNVLRRLDSNGIKPEYIKLISSDEYESTVYYYHTQMITI